MKKAAIGIYVTEVEYSARCPDCDFRVHAPLRDHHITGSQIESLRAMIVSHYHEVHTLDQEPQQA